MTINVAELRARRDAAVARRDAAAGSDRDPAMCRVSGSLLTRLGEDTDRRLAAYVAADAEVQNLTSWLLRAEQRQAEAARVHLTRDQVVGARAVRDRHGWHRVIRVNAMTVTVETGYSWHDRIGFDRLLEVAS